MNKAVLEIYQNIVNAKIGEPISTKVNGHYWGQSVETLLNDQGYKRGKDYETSFNWGTGGSNTWILRIGLKVSR